MQTQHSRFCVYKHITSRSREHDMLVGARACLYALPMVSSGNWRKFARIGSAWPNRGNMHFAILCEKFSTPGWKGQARFTHRFHRKKSNIWEQHVCQEKTRTCFKHPLGQIRVWWYLAECAWYVINSFKAPKTKPDTFIESAGNSRWIAGCAFLQFRVFYSKCEQSLAHSDTMGRCLPSKLCKASPDRQNTPVWPAWWLILKMVK